MRNEGRYLVRDRVLETRQYRQQRHGTKDDPALVVDEVGRLDEQ